jgi:hypothetical protein
MTEPVDLDAKRKAKAPKCELCGDSAHQFEAGCPRVYAVTFEPDGGVTYHLHDIDDGPADAA